MKIRKDKTRAKYLTNTGYDDLEVRDWSADPDKSARNTELQEILQEGIDQLPPDLRVTVVLRDVQSLSNDEAAESLDITVSALKSRLHRGRVLLRKFLEERQTTPASV